MLEIEIVKLTTAIVAKLVDRAPSDETEEIADINYGIMAIRLDLLCC